MPAGINSRLDAAEEKTGDLEDIKKNQSIMALWRTIFLIQVIIDQLFTKIYKVFFSGL